MFDRITLGLNGDVGMIQSRLTSYPECVFPISFSKDETSDSLTYIDFDPTDDVFMLDRYVNVIAEYIIERYETRLLRRILDEEYRDLSSLKKREIIKNIEFFGDDPTIGYKARKESVILSIFDYLKEDSTMLIDGFVAFRLKEYEALLSQLAEKLVDHYLAQKEYEEFIDLLKYFVNVQEARPEKIHIIISDSGGYTLLDEQEKDITAPSFADFMEGEVLLTEDAYDDLLISVLITIAPKTLVVHNCLAIRNHELFSTISRVFDGKIEYCSGCPVCEN